MQSKRVYQSHLFLAPRPSRLRGTSGSGDENDWMGLTSDQKFERDDWHAFYFLFHFLWGCWLVPSRLLWENWKSPRLHNFLIRDDWGRVRWGWMNQNIVHMETVWLSRSRFFQEICHQGSQGIQTADLLDFMIMFIMSETNKTDLKLLRTNSRMLKIISKM